MARESRLSRRILADALSDRVKTARPGQVGFRAVVSSSMPGTAYLFLCFADDSRAEDAWRQVRRELLAAYCLVFAWKNRGYRQVIGIATELGVHRATRSHDVVVLKDPVWDSKTEGVAREAQTRYGILRERNLRIQHFHDNEYPEATNVTSSKPQRSRPRSMRNSLCPCGSGRKFKKCCYRLVGQRL
jgi:hypothetical protein